MDWAKDQLGNLIHATERPSFSYGLRCPLCEQSVFRKAGPHRRSHFSHYGYSAKPECEFYHPPIDAIRAPVAPARPESQIQREETPFSPGGIFLRRNSSRGASFVLRLPRVASTGDRDSNEITVVSGVGSKTFTAQQLQKTQYVPVIAGTPIARVSCQDGLMFLRDAIERDVDQFEATGNFFKLGEAGGRLVQRHAPLELGSTYWLVTRVELRAPTRDLGLTIRSDGVRRGWHHYEVALRDPVMGEATDDLDALAQYLGRPVRVPGHAAFFIDPPAHHIDVDGTYVFPEGTSSILVRYTAGARVAFYADDAAHQEIPVEDDGLGWIRIIEAPRGYFYCFVDGHEHLVGCAESCPLFRSSGLSVGVGDERAAPMIQASFFEPVSGQTINVVCPSERVAEYVHALNPNSSRDALAIRIRQPTSATLWLNAGNFGRLRRLEPKVAPEVRTVNPLAAAPQTWLLGVLQRYFPESQRLPGIGWNRLDAICLAPRLAPYIRKLTSQQRDGLQEY